MREEADAVINTLHKIGINKAVMMTGDSERTAAARRKVIMIGDGINDLPALSAADVGITISYRV